ncbi:MAG: sigma-70 family RNA polymerase sigma factor [Candidatus Eisenbacteria bacterium]
MPDDRLVAETLAGSQAAYEALIGRYERRVFRVAWSYARERDGALDICQDVFVTAYRSLASYRRTDSFRPWLMQIAHRKSSNWRRDNRRHHALANLERVPEPGIDPVQESSVLADETRRTLLDRLQRLNPRQRQALTMRYFERAPVPEIARALECSEGVARNILFRGLEKMRVQWESSRSGS